MKSPTHKNIFVTSKSTTHKVLFWSFADMHRAAKKFELPDAQLRMNGEMLFLVSALILQTRALSQSILCHVFYTSVFCL